MDHMGSPKIRGNILGGGGGGGGGGGTHNEECNSGALSKLLVSPLNIGASNGNDNGT